MTKNDTPSSVQLQSIYDIRRDNLKVLISRVFLSRKVAADKLQFGQESLVSRYLGSKQIGASLARKIERAAGKADNWLDVDHSRHQERPLPLSAMMESTNSGLKIFRNVPVINWEMAGQWQSLGEESMASVEEWLPCAVDASEQTFALRIRGISMEPRFHEGEIIFVDPSVRPSHGKFVVVRLPGRTEAILRQLNNEGGRYVLTALNADWPTPIIEVNEDSILCGTVIFKGEIL